MKCSAVMLVIFMVGLLGCSSRAKKPALASEMGTEFKLKKDRSDMEALRKDIPEEIRAHNDESAYLINLFQDKQKNPQDISNKFNSDVRRKRDEFSKWERQKREEYTRQEVRRREDYMSESKKKREDSSVKSLKSQERSRFFQDLEVNRRQFFSGESDARRNFESELKQIRSDFEAEMKDLRSRYDHEYKAYSQAYNEKKKTNPSTGYSLSPTTGVPPGFTEQDMKDIQSLPKSNKSLLYPGNGSETEE
ncbi:MAG: hypothetical protein AB7F59_00310 [Bdellovibrionales bacterium]